MSAKDAPRGNARDQRRPPQDDIGFQRVPRVLGPERWLQRAVRVVRWAGLLLAGVGSVLAAGGLLWVLVRPEVLGEVPTGALLGVLALVVLPVATACVWWWERRLGREARLASTTDPFGPEGDRLVREAVELVRAADAPARSPGGSPEQARHAELLGALRAELRAQIHEELESEAAAMPTAGSGPGIGASPGVARSSTPRPVVAPLPRHPHQHRPRRAAATHDRG